MAPLFVLPFILLVVLASFSSGDPNFAIVRCCKGIWIGDEQGRLVTVQPVMTTRRGPSWAENNYREDRDLA
jgi:hypothetical protein